MGRVKDVGRERTAGRQGEPQVGQRTAKADGKKKREQRNERRRKGAKEGGQNRRWAPVAGAEI